MLDTLQSLDLEALLLFNGSHTPFWDTVMPVATNRWTWVPLYILLMLLLVRRCGWRTALVWLVAIALAITLADQITASLIRPWVARLRPSNLDNPHSALVTIVDGYRAGRYGFPSSHAANTIALTIVYAVAYRARWVTWMLVAWTALNCWSRMYLGVHYPGDILVGLVVGTLAALLVAWVTRRLLLRYQTSLQP